MSGIGKPTTDPLLFGVFVFDGGFNFNSESLAIYSRDLVGKRSTVSILNPIQGHPKYKWHGEIGEVAFRNESG